MEARSPSSREFCQPRFTSKVPQRRAASFARCTNSKRPGEGQAFLPRARLRVSPAPRNDYSPFSARTATSQKPSPDVIKDIHTPQDQAYWFMTASLRSLFRIAALTPAKFCSTERARPFSGSAPLPPMCVCLAAPLAGIPVEASTIGFFAQTRCKFFRKFRKCCAEPAHKEVHD